MPVDVDAAYDAYLARFEKHFGDKPEGAFVKFDRHMVQKLGRDAFGERLGRYLDLHRACKDMLQKGSTINDAVVLEYEEAASWIAIQVPNVHDMFQGELGDPDVATGAVKDPEPG